MYLPEASTPGSVFRGTGAEHHDAADSSPTATVDATFPPRDSGLDDDDDEAAAGGGAVVTAVGEGTAIYPRRDAARPRTLVDVIRETIAKYPSAPALDDGSGALTYEQLEQRVLELANRLWGADVGAGDRVGVRVPSGSSDLYVAILGVLFAGAAYVPVDADEPDGRADIVFSEAGVCAVIEANLKLTVVQGIRTRGNSPEPHSQDDAWIIFTSGSTGKPKGVAITHRSAAAFVAAEQDLFCLQEPLGPGDRVLAGLSVSFDASCEEMWLAWGNGACLVPAPREVVRSGADLGPWLTERNVTVVSTVPTLAAMWPEDTLKQVRLLIFGGEACPQELATRLAGPGREVWNTYGPTETTVVACASRLGANPPVRIGLPLNGWDLAVADQDGEPVAWGEEGELIIGGVGLGRYLDQEKDAEKYGSMPGLGWNRAYRSGDLVRADQEGLVFMGRVDEQVKLAGRRVELGEIDEALSALPGVAAGAAAVQTLPGGNQVLAGYLVPVEGDDPDLVQLRNELGKTLPAQIVPTLGAVDALPLKSSGKVDRKALPWPIPQANRGTDTGVELNADLRWLGQRWSDLLGPLDLTGDSDFFGLGGASLAAAQLVASLRERYPEVAIADIYAHPTLSGMSVHLMSMEDSTDEMREIRPTPWWMGWAQTPVILGLYTVTGLRYVTGIALVCFVMFNFTDRPWVPNPPLLPTLAAWVVLSSLPFRMLGSIAASRLLLLGIRPGIYQRGGPTHLRIWAAERITTYSKLEPIMGTPMGLWYAKALGCRLGDDVDLHAMPPVTGLLAVGSRTVIEYEADIAGHWIDGDLLHVGRIQVGEDARVGTRSTLLNGAFVDHGAEVEPGTCVSGLVPAGQRWAGSQMEHVGTAGEDWPAEANHASRPRAVTMLYPLSLAGMTLMPLIALIPGALVMIWALDGISDFVAGLWVLAIWAPVFIVMTMASYLLLTAAAVRALARLMPAGYHPLHSRAAWAAWLSEQLLTRTMISMFPLYASLLTPVWMRLLGARVGPGVEISTAETIPHLTTVGARSFLADHSLVSTKRARNGWMYLGHSRVGEKSFVGNSAIVGGGTDVADDSLIAVLSSAPDDMPPRSSWFGRPAVELPRSVEATDDSRTYAPPRKLVIARGLVEACRILPAIITAWLALATVFVLGQAHSAGGWLGAALWSGPVLLASGFVALLVALAAKWVLVGRFTATERPLWNSFVWRNELADVFSESLAVPGLVRMSLGTPMLNVWLRCMGTRIGSRVWCETWWLPEFDLIELGDNVTINRGTVLQTHLFHDRIMRMDGVRMAEGSTLGPNSIILPGSSLEAKSMVGACSLAMREESVPADTSWAGNPLRRAEPETTRLVQRFNERSEAVTEPTETYGNELARR